MPSQLNGFSFTQRKIAAGLVSIVLFGATQLSYADTTPITLQNTAGTWTNLTYAVNGPLWAGGPEASYFVVQNNPNDGSLSWGDSAVAGGNANGLLFHPTSNGSTYNLNTAFELGTLTHSNYAIWSDTAITNAGLGLQLSLNGAGPVTTGPFNFSIASSCPSSTVNANPCDDTISFSAASTQFNLAGQLYSFNLLGFYKDQLSFSDNMITTANSTKSGSLMASITAVQTTPVPAPAALWLLGSGLLGLAGFAKRKHTHQ